VLSVYGTETYSKLAQMLLKTRIYAVLGSEMFFFYILLLVQSFLFPPKGSRYRGVGVRGKGV
jgi:hypothetical protein